MLWSSKHFLTLCQKLKEADIVFPQEPGTRVARGFADLGVEEFLLLPAGKSLSLFTGKTADFLAEHAHFFYVLPTADQLVQELVRRRAVIVGLEFYEERNWRLTLRTPGVAAEIRVEDFSLPGVVAQGLLAIPRYITQSTRHF